MPVFLKISETLLKIQEIERTKQCPAKVTTLFGGDKVYVQQKIQSGEKICPRKNYVQNENFKNEAKYTLFHQENKRASYRTMLYFSIVFYSRTCFPNTKNYLQISKLSPKVIKEATKSYFMHYSCLIIVLFNTALSRSAFYTVSFRKLVFCLSELSWPNQDIKICAHHAM